MATRTHTYLNQGFTPQAEKHLPPSSVEGKIPCIHFGPIKQAVIYVRPGRVRYQLKKYQELGETLKIPADYDLSQEPVEELPSDDQVTAVLTARPPRGPRETPIICLNTGRFFDSKVQAARMYGISAAVIGMHLRGKCQQAKGRRFRAATEAEIAAADMDITWKYTGELLPLLNGKHTK